MFKKRTCWIIGCLVLAQVGMIILYHGVLTGDAAPAVTPKDETATRKASPAQKSTKIKRDIAPSDSVAAPGGPQVDRSVADAAPKGELIPMALQTAPSVETKPEEKKVASVEPPAPPANLPPLEKPGTVVVPQSELAGKDSFSKPIPPGEPASPNIKQDEPATGAASTGLVLASGTTPVNPPAKDAVPPVAPLLEKPKNQDVTALPAPKQSESTTIPESVPLVPSRAVEPPVAARVGPPPVAPVAPTSPPLVVACPWALKLALVNGKTHLTAQSGKEVCFEIVCEQLNLQAPRGNIDAQGGVKLTSSGMEGSCDHLTICWQEDQVVMDGQAQLKCQREGQEIELKAGKLSLRLSPNAARQEAVKQESKCPPKDDEKPNPHPSAKTQPSVESSVPHP